MTDARKELEELRERVSELDLPLKKSATNLVFGKGNPNAPIVFIGEAPGEKEDLQGIPFVGRAGKQLDGLLNSIGLGLDDVYIANILKYRPPNNRDPNKEEIAAHTPHLIEQLKIIKPKVIATLGNYSSKFVLGGFSVEGMKGVSGISSLHGRPHEVSLGDVKTLVIPLYHPAAMLYRPALRDVLAQDFLKMAEVIGLDVPGKEKQMKLSNL